MRGLQELCRFVQLLRQLLKPSGAPPSARRSRIRSLRCRACYSLNHIVSSFQNALSSSLLFRALSYLYLIGSGIPEISEDTPWLWVPDPGGRGLGVIGPRISGSGGSGSGSGKRDIPGFFSGFQKLRRSCETARAQHTPSYGMLSDQFVPCSIVATPISRICTACTRALLSSHYSVGHLMDSRGLETEYADSDALWVSLRGLGKLILHPKHSEIAESPTPGDVLFFQCTPGYYHYGIYQGRVEGRGFVIDNDVTGGDACSIARKTFAEFARPAREAVKVVVYDETDDEAVERRRKTLRNAERLLQECRGNVYDPEKFNCQQFVFLCQEIRCVRFPPLKLPARTGPPQLTKFDWVPVAVPTTTTRSQP